ncbi:tyrosine-type recombinase/integrase [Actinomadura graeca]|uniref:Tyrosine-type recombinase/integrase n=1 Tax=Actinomadura graeca TaxID=2750812 RepID=A0ABX8QUT8_9ACTN|nr:tyrosine-type recombinase/integrase [Actinomadura graeca]QXJ22513.1 tyrosine-type recombinase/integrase [Actinomadura graeca]
MQNITYDARIYKTEVYKGKSVTTYTARWKVGPQVWRESFRVKAQVDSFQAELRAAARKGEAFDVTTGRPVSWGRAKKDMSWYAFCLAYVDMKWKGISAKHRANTAWALVTVTPVMLATERGRSKDQHIRTALRRWAFNTKNRPTCPPDVAEVLRWVENNTKPMSVLNDPAAVRELLNAAATRLDGKPAAPSTVQRNRAILHHACEYAVEIGVLPNNPIKTTKWKARSKSSAEVDRRSVVNHAQARRLLGAVRRQRPSGQRLMAFFAVIYYAALRPEEAVNLRVENVTLPALVWADDTQKWQEPIDDWGELHFNTASPEVGTDWTDDGANRERRQLKGRAEGAWRRVPTPPPLTRILRAHLRDIGPGPGGRLFWGIRGGELASITYRRAWDAARRVALSEAEYASPLARRVYDLRHACVSTWLNGGVPPTDIAEWAGHSVEVLLRVYAKCIEGQHEAAKRRIEQALRDG